MAYMTTLQHLLLQTFYSPGCMSASNNICFSLPCLPHEVGYKSKLITKTMTREVLTQSSINVDTNISPIFPSWMSPILKSLFAFLRRMLTRFFHTTVRQSSEECQSEACSPAFQSSLTELLCGLGDIHIASRSGYSLGHGILK